ncbi:hypothetical protein MMARV_C048P2 [viral metagenome]|uniref:Uncharacterized protein n=1 Tax=viral metagenome TaxID=1070528 RepID=A0A6L2ZKA6_9ZZZZ
MIPPFEVCKTKHGNMNSDILSKFSDLFEFSRDSVPFHKIPFGASYLYNSDLKQLSGELLDKNKEDAISSLILDCPELPKEVYKLEGDEFKISVLLYKIRVLCFFLGYIEAHISHCDYLVHKFGMRRGLSDFINDLSGAGFEPQIILSATSEIVRKFQSKYQTYEDLDLTLDEIDSLEKIRERRRLINSHFTVLFNEDKYKLGSESFKLQCQKDREKALEQASSILFKIVTLGVQYLNSSHRLSLKLDRSLRVDEVLKLFRASEIRRFKENPSSYSLPKRVS